jgi:pyrophosphate--fructose-6-phosphate 1-phosphotransferase
MGRKASHVALECALQSHPNMVCFFPYLPVTCRNFFCLYSFELVSYVQVILGEEVAASKLTIFDITKQICDAVQARAEKGWFTSLLSMRR